MGSIRPPPSPIPAAPVAPTLAHPLGAWPVRGGHLVLGPALAGIITPMPSFPPGPEIAASVTPPPVPWRMTGRMHMALFRDEGRPPPLPAQLRPLLRGHRVIALVRYLEGTLRYDELVIGRLARRGLRLGMFVDHIWVDSPESVAGGRLFWGLPKEMAEFRWSEDQVTVIDAEGEIATLTVDQGPARRPTVSLTAPGFGVRDGQLLQSHGKLRVRLRGASLRVVGWAPRFASIALRPQVGFDAAPFQLVIGEPRVLG